MKKKYLVSLLMLAAVLALTLLACARPTPEPVASLQLTVEVSRNGFNNRAGEFQIEVEKGQEVEITFVYGDRDLPQNNPHNIASPDYGIQTGTLDRDNPEATLRFTAKKSGDVIFGCITPGCSGHHNLHARSH